MNFPESVCASNATFQSANANGANIVTLLIVHISLQYIQLIYRIILLAILSCIV